MNMMDKIVKKIVQYASYKQASDIYIEEKGHKVEINYVLLGNEEESITQDHKLNIIERFKKELDIPNEEIAISNRYYKIIIGSSKISILLSLLEEKNRRKLSLQIIPPGKKVFSLKQLAFQKEQLELIKEYIHKKKGLILISGPENSGRSSTIYSLLNTLDSSKINISSLEYTIEQDIPGVNQIHINQEIGLDFKKLLDALLKQDSEVIMLEEIHDPETAKHCFSAAASGRLIFSSLESTSAIETIFKLENLGIKKRDIMDNLKLIINQRLIRKICPHCIQKYDLDSDAMDKFKKYTNIEVSHLYQGRGCSKCNNTGYYGKIAIHEVLLITERIKEMIYRPSSHNKIKQIAQKQGFITLEQDAFSKAKIGISTIDEIIALNL